MSPSVTVRVVGGDAVCAGRLRSPHDPTALVGGTSVPAGAPVERSELRVSRPADGG